MNEKYRKVAIIVAIILGAGGVLYVGGLFSQLMTNYQVWMDSGGMWGNAFMRLSITASSNSRGFLS